MSVLELAPLALAGIGTAAVVGGLRWYSFRGRRRVATAMAEAGPAPAPVVDPQPTQPIMRPTTASVRPAPVELPQALRTDLGQPVATLPPAHAPRHEPIPRVTVDPDETAPLANGEPELPEWVKGGLTQAIEQAEFMRYCSLAEFAQMSDQEQSGAQR